MKTQFASVVKIIRSDNGQIFLTKTVLLYLTLMVLYIKVVVSTPFSRMEWLRGNTDTSLMLPEP